MTFDDPIKNLFMLLIIDTVIKYTFYFYLSTISTS
jgi:hypothetical protein